MHIDWQIASLPDWNADAVLFFAFEDASELLPGFKRWVDTEGTWLSGSAAIKDFQGKLQQTLVCYGPSDRPIPRLVCVGLGPAGEFDAEKLRNATVSGLRKCRELQLARPALPLCAFDGLPLEPAYALEEALIGGMAGLYRYDGLKTRKIEPSQHPELLLILSEKEPGEPLRSIPFSAESIVSGISLARDLVSAPANQMTPSSLLNAASRLADTFPFKLEVIDYDKARSLGMGAFAAVAQGSREPAYCIVLEHCPPGTEQEPPLAFVGKGITFDTGGISLKSSAGMEAMKQDMAGAGAILGVFEVLGRMQLQRHVLAVLPCTENMPGGKAYKPGDVLSSLAGLTIEVISTDAEGRLVLSDAIAYATRFRPALIVDIATLTGACIVALGHQVSAVMSNREALAQKIQELGGRVGEKFWPLPLWDFYFENIKSDVADFKNVGDRSAGTIIGGIFLKQFVPEDIPWAHLDIAGTAWTDKDLATSPKGATGFGVRTLVELTRRWPQLEIR